MAIIDFGAQYERTYDNKLHHAHEYQLHIFAKIEYYSSSCYIWTFFQKWMDFLTYMYFG